MASCPAGVLGHGLERSQVERLRRVVDDTDRAGLDLAVRLARAGRHHERELRVTSPQRLRENMAGHVGQAFVDDRERERLHASEAHRLPTARGGIDPEAEARQRRRDAARSGLVAVGDEGPPAP